MGLAVDHESFLGARGHGNRAVAAHVGRDRVIGEVYVGRRDPRARFQQRPSGVRHPPAADQADFHHVAPLGPDVRRLPVRGQGAVVPKCRVVRQGNHVLLVAQTDA